MRSTYANPATGDRGARQQELHFGRNVVTAEINNHCTEAAQAPSGPPDAKPFAKSAGARVPAALCHEQSDSYPRIVARLNAQWRVVSCRDGVQWILQIRCGQRDGLPRWKNRYFFRTREGLARGSYEYARDVGGDALIILLRLPECFPEGAP